MIEIGQGGDDNRWVKNNDVELLQLVTTQQGSGQITASNTVNLRQRALQWNERSLPIDPAVSVLSAS